MTEQKQQYDKKENDNLLSKISPPAALPGFVTSSVFTEKTENSSQQKETSDPFIQTAFSAAIPPNKSTADSSSEVTAATISSNLNKMTLNPEPAASALDPIAQSGSSLFEWMRDAISTGGILHKVAEKAKNSVDTLVTTLDPQMKDYINSSGDREIIVASDKEEKIRPIREAFNAIFGRVTVTGFSAQSQTVAAQPVGFKAALTAADFRIEKTRQTFKVEYNLPVVAIENFIIEAVPDQWFDAGLILLNDPSRNIIVSTITQFTPIPKTVITTIRADTPEDYKFKDTGFAVAVGNVMANSLETHHSEWHKTYTSVNRTDMILSATKSLAYLYKKALSD